MKKLVFLFILSQILGFKNLSASHSFYVGTNIGLGILSGKRNDSATNNNLITAVLANNKSVHAQGACAGIFTGYLFRIENFGVGPDFFYNYGKFTNTIRGSHNDPLGGINTAFEITHKISSQMGANVRLGYFLESYFLYGSIGITYQKAQFEMLASRVDILGGGANQYGYKPRKKKTSAFTFGFGAQKAIAENYAVGIECKFATFPKKNFSFTHNDAERTTLTSNFKYQLRSVALKVMYVF
jgi:opacity protein-like surface antigen